MCGTCALEIILTSTSGEYQIGSAWTTVYHPPIICNTYWNYECGTEVVIPITDPRVPWYTDPIPVPGKQVAILSIGHEVSIKEIKRVTAVAEEGLTDVGEPFGGSLELRSGLAMA